MAAFAVAIACCAWASGNWDDEAAVRKAECLFYESEAAIHLDDPSRAMALSARAYELNPNDPEIAMTYGANAIYCGAADPDSLQGCFAMMKRFFYANPTPENCEIMGQAALDTRNFHDILCALELVDSLYPSDDDRNRRLVKLYEINYLMGTDSLGIQKAIGIYERQEAAKGKSVELTSGKLDLMRYLDSVDYVSELESLAASAPGSSSVLRFVGSKYLEMEDYDEAKRYIDRLIEVDSTDSQSLLLRSTYLQATGDTISSNADLLRIINGVDLDLDEKLGLVDAVVSEYKNYPDFIEDVFADMLKQYDGDNDLEEKYMSWIESTGNYSYAAQLLRSTIDANGGDAEQWSRLISLLSQAGEDEAANEAIDEAIELLPGDNLVFYLYKASMQNVSGDTAAALATLNKVNASEFDNDYLAGLYYTFKSNLEYIEGDTKAAIESAKGGIACNPNDASGYNNAAYFMSLLGVDLEEAEKYASEALRLEPTNPTYLDTYAWVCFQLKDYEQARKYIDKAMMLYAMHSTKGQEYEITEEIYDHAGDIYYMCGSTEKALEFWKMALELNPGNGLIMLKVNNHSSEEE